MAQEKKGLYFFFSRAKQDSSERGTEKEGKKSDLRPDVFLFILLLLCL